MRKALSVKTLQGVGRYVDSPSPRDNGPSFYALAKHAVILTVMFMLVTVVHARAEGNAQEKIKLLLKNVSLQKAFSAIEKMTDYVFFYDVSVLKDTKPVSIDAKDVSVEEVLDILLKGQDLTYSVHDKTIFIKKWVKGATSESVGPDPGSKDSANAEDEMSGVVYNEYGQPLSGANITIEESGKGTITNAKGEFILRKLPSKCTVLISFIGYARQNVPGRRGANVQVYLKTANNELDKAVVQAYGTTTDRLKTGDISTVTAEQIERQPVMNPIAALQGQVPGLVVTQGGAGAYASAPLKVEIRGRSGLNPDLPSDPLYVIDGVPLTIADFGKNGNYASGSTGITQNGFNGPAGGQSPFFSINPEDIESISVLKDGDATAIYGSRGANGVILITTKKGKPGPAKFEAKVYEGESRVTNHYALLNTSQYLQMRHEAFFNDGISPSSQNAYDLLQWDTTRNVDWQKLLWGGVGTLTDVNTSLSGGDKQFTFHLSGTYHREREILTKTGSDQRGSLQSNLGYKSMDQKLNLTFTSTYSYTFSNLISVPNAVLLPPDAPAIYDARGNLNYTGWGDPNSPSAQSYEFAQLLQPYTAQTDFLNSHISAQYQIVNGLSLDIATGYSSYYQNQKYFQPIASQDPRTDPVGYATFGNNSGSNFIIEPKLEYKRRIAKGDFNFLVGGTYQSVSSVGSTLNGSGYTDDNLLGAIANAKSVIGSNGSGQYKYDAIFGRLNYNWDETYVANFTTRRDGSSKFGPGKQFGNFGSVGLAWIFTKEKWFPDFLKFLSFGKLGGSYGTTGSDQIPSYAYLSQWSAVMLPYYQGSAPSYSSQLLSNPNLVWQSNHKLEGSLSLGFLNDAILVDVAYYRNRCGNQLIPFHLPAITGFTSVTANFPAVVQNSGLESKVKYKFADSKVFSGTVYFDIGVNKNKLLSYPGLSQSPYASIYKVGEPLNIQPVLHYMGVDPQTGQYTFFDRNHDGIIEYSYNNGNSDTYDKDLSIRFDGGFGTDLRYKKVTLNLFFVFREQQLRNAFYSGSNPGNLSNESNQPVQVMNRWRKPGDAAEFARFTTSGAESDYAVIYSDLSYSDGSYIRLRNVSLSYDLAPHAKGNVRPYDIKVFVRGQNLFLFTRFNGVDPDTPELGSLPVSKDITLGIQFNL